MARLNAIGSRYGIDNSTGGGGGQFVVAGPDVSGLGVFDATNFQFLSAFFGGTGHGWFEGTGFTTNLVGGDHIPLSGTVTSLSVDFLGGSAADFTLDQFSLSLVDLYNAGFSYFETVVFASDDTLGGSNFADTLYGYAGHDKILGRDGADNLFGGIGNDQLFGGDGVDYLEGGAGNDRLDGGTGDDTMLGGADNDVYVVRDAGDTVTELAAEGTDTVVSLVSYTLGANVEHLRLNHAAGAASATGNGLNNRITGNSSDNVISGLDGSDRIAGLGGVDIIFGGAGSDTIRGGGGNDVINGDAGNDFLTGDAGVDVINGGADNDRISGGADGDTLRGDGGRDRIFGGAGSDRIEGGTSADWLFGGADGDLLIGEDGNDYLDGGTGDDDMYGGLGNDTFVVRDLGDTVHEGHSQGNDTVISFLSYTLDNNVERLRLANAAGVADGTGNSLNNQIYGNSSANTLNGLDGNDRMFGRGGADTLLGGQGNDYLDGGGDDDIMTGGTGNDTYILRDVGDVLNEVANEGRDLVVAHFSYILEDNFETLRLHANAGVSYGGGNSLNNRLYGNEDKNHLFGLDGNDRIFGGGGEDAIVGGKGNDYLDGQADADKFLFEVGDGNDVIANYEHGLDLMAFVGLTFSDLSFSAHGTGVMVDYGASDTIYLEGVGGITLTAADFVFF